MKGKNIFQETTWNTLRIECGWLISVSAASFIYFKGNSLSRDKFKELISKKLKERETFILKKKEMLLDVDPKFARIFQNSNMVSGLVHSYLMFFLVHKGRSHHLLKKSIFKKKKEKFEEETKDKEELLKSIPSLKDEIYELRKELTEKEEQLRSNQVNAKILDDLFKKGIIDQDGNVLD